MASPASGCHRRSGTKIYACNATPFSDALFLKAFFRFYRPLHGHLQNKSAFVAICLENIVIIVDTSHSRKSAIIRYNSIIQDKTQLSLTLCTLTRQFAGIFDSFRFIWLIPEKSATLMLNCAPPKDCQMKHKSDGLSKTVLFTKL